MRRIYEPGPGCNVVNHKHERTTQRVETYQGDDSTMKASDVTDNQRINNEQGTESKSKGEKRERTAKKL